MATSELIPAGQVVRHEFGAQQIENRAETASAAVAAREQAAVQARYSMALMRRRDVDQFRVDLLKECRRPGFAEMAEYHRPVGKEKNEETGQWEEKIATGPSVHLIRTAIALFGNMLVDSATMYESTETRLVHAYVLDLERNVSWARTIALSKLTEKRGVRDNKTKEVGPPKGREVISERLNTFGDKVYIVTATEDEVRTKEARLLAIAQRENGRSVLPRDILDEAIRTARETISKADAADPDAARRKLIDAFSEQGVRPENLAEYLGHGLDRVTPAELKELRGVFVSIREGESTWADVMTVKNPAGTKAAAQEVAQDKLAKLGLGKKDNNQPQENGGARTVGQVATDPASGKTDTSVEDRNAREIPPSTGPGPELRIPEHQAAVAQYRAVVGDEAFLNILGAHGCENITFVDDKNWKEIAADCEKAKAALPKEEPKKQARLKL